MSSFGWFCTFAAGALLLSVLGELTYNLKRRHASAYVCMPTAVLTVMLLMPFGIAACIRSSALDDIGKNLGLQKVVVLKNDTDSLVNYKVQKETMCRSETIEFFLSPGDCKCLSSTTGGYHVICAKSMD